MRTRTKVIYGTFLAVLVMAAPLTANARPWGHNGNMSGWHQGVPQEKQQAFYTMMEQQQEKMRPIQEQIWAKQETLDALSGNPKVDPKEITTLINEISTLRNQAYAEHKSFEQRVRKETGVDIPYGGGMGYGHRGQNGDRYGGGRGYGGGHGGCGR